MTARIEVGAPAWGCTGCMRTFNRHGQQMPTGCNACPHWGGACTFVEVPAVYRDTTPAPSSLMLYTCGPLHLTHVPDAIKGLVQDDIVEALRRAWLTAAYGAGKVSLQQQPGTNDDNDNKGSPHG